MQAATLINTTNAYVIGSFQDVLIGVWRAKPPRGAAASIEKAMISITRRWDRVSMLNISEPAVTLPDAEERATLLDVVRRRLSQIRCAAIVLETDGLKGVAVRAAVTGITMMARGGHPTGTFATVGEAAAWLAPQMAKTDDLGVSRYEIMAAVRELRR
jgi:hypothetical protein